MIDSVLNRRSFAATVLSTAFAPIASIAQSERPNLVSILAGDLGYGDAGCYGCADIRTPNLDRLAEHGVRLTDCYASAPASTPTRCALMTGRYQQRLNNLEWSIFPCVKTVGLPPEEATIATLLREAGYATGAVGKWHLGYCPEHDPNQHGFDEFFGFLGNSVDEIDHTDTDGEPDLYENGQSVTKPGAITDLITERSVEFIQHNTGKPFFLYTAFNAPHVPMREPVMEDEENGFSQNDPVGRTAYIQSVERMDRGVGRILGAIKEKGLEENTLVVFSSDGGGAPLSGGKGHLRESGIRIPCLMRWPEVIPAGSVSRQMAIMMDLSVTLLSAARVKPPRPLDGITLFSYVAGYRPCVDQTFVWRNDWCDEKAVRWGKWKFLKERDREYLFNLEEDIGETGNRIDRNIDIYHWLKDLHADWEKAMIHRQSRFGSDLRGTIGIE